MKTKLLLTCLLLALSTSASAIRLRNVEYTCPIGGEKFTAFIDATGYFSSGFIDTRPFTRFVTPIELPQCPSNKFVMFKDEFSPDELAKFERVVSSAEYQQIDARSPQFFALGRMMELAGENQDAWQMMIIFLKANWQSHDHHEPSQRKTLEYADKVLANKKKISRYDALSTQILRGKMLRLLGRFDEAKRVLTALQKNPAVRQDESLSQVVTLQLRMVGKKNRYSEWLDEVEKNTP